MSINYETLSNFLSETVDELNQEHEERFARAGRSLGWTMPQLSPWSLVGGRTDWSIRFMGVTLWSCVPEDPGPLNRSELRRELEEDAADVAEVVGLWAS
jgi:hypothetical protein